MISQRKIDFDQEVSVRDSRCLAPFGKAADLCNFGNVCLRDIFKPQMEI